MNEQRNDTPLGPVIVVGDGTGRLEYEWDRRGMILTVRCPACGATERISRGWGRDVALEHKPSCVLLAEIEARR